MKKIIIEPVKIDFKAIKFPQIEKMLGGMSIPLLRIDTREFILDFKKFISEDKYKPKYQLDQILGNMYHIKLAVDELDRRTCGDYKKNMSKISLIWKVSYYYFKFTEENNKVIVELKR